MRKEDTSAIEQDMQKVDQQLEQVLARIVNTDNERLISAYEDKLQKLEEQKLVLSEKIANSGADLPCFDSTFRTALEFLKNPHKLWLSDKLADKRTVLKLVFAEGVSYDRKEGLRTAPIAQPIRAMGDIWGSKKCMAHPAGFEPATPGSGNQCSIP